MEQTKITVTSTKGPKAIGPYSAAVKTDSFVFTSGQLGLDPYTNELVPGGVEAETRKALENLQLVLEAAGTKLANVVKTTVFLNDIQEFSKMNSIYAEFFPENPPARSAIQVAALPKGAAVEIESIALL
jgi:2-iminobutanoate/2-iminopropanoate deaminase